MRKKLDSITRDAFKVISRQKLNDSTKLQLLIAYFTHACLIGNALAKELEEKKNE